VTSLVIAGVAVLVVVNSNKEIKVEKKGFQILLERVK
jgi:hypothetical protein